MLSLGTTVLMMAAAVACSQTPKNPDVESQIQRSLNAAGLNDVTADQDRDKGVVTLSGKVTTEQDKDRAGQIATTEGQGQIVANQVAVEPPGDEGVTQDTQSALDDGIEDNYKAKIIQNNLDGVDYDSEQGVITLTGKVDTQAQRTKAEQLASAVPNVKQVINKLEVKNQMATSK
jgi:hyperosmotically inducible protein